jgi:DNA polymerase III epsilon subunit-like protein
VDLISNEELQKQRSATLSCALADPFLVIDTETNAEDIRDGRGFCIGISIAAEYKGEIKGAYFPVAHTEDNIPDAQKTILFNIIKSRRRLGYHNAKFDIPSLATAGLDVFDIPFYCTMIMCHMLNENKPKGLDWLIKNELHLPDGKVKDPVWQAMFNIYGWSPDFPARAMSKYATEDAIRTRMLFNLIYPFFVEAGFDGPVEKKTGR